MRKGVLSIVGAVIVVALVGAVFGPAVRAQPASPAAGAKAGLGDNWNSFLHFIRLAQHDVAASYGQAILNARPDPRELYKLWVDTAASGTTLARGAGSEKLAPIVKKISALVEKGALLARSDQIEIQRWIKMLGGGTRAYLIASERLKRAGEYAAPQLIAALSDENTPPVLRERIVGLLRKFGKDAVRPLCEALNSPKPTVRETVCRALGAIGYRHAAPYLKELADRKGLIEQVRAAALGALSATAGRVALKKPAAELYYEMARKYYNRAESLGPDTRYDQANVWYWRNGQLDFKVVPSAIFNEIYAMRMAGKALELDPKNFAAACLWVAANYRREINLAKLPAGTVDPTHPAGAPGADYYGLAGGAKVNQKVLERALADGDVPLALRAIAALKATTGAKNLVEVLPGGAQPLVAALTHPSKRLRFRAAEVLALSRQHLRFPGWNLVVPTLVEALRQTGARTAVLADPNPESRNKLKDLLRLAKYKVFDAPQIGPALSAARKAGGADLVVLASDITGPGLAEAVTLLRTEPAFRNAPVVAVSKTAGVMVSNRLARRDGLVEAIPAAKLDADTLNQAIAKLAGEGSDLTPEEATRWAIAAAGRLGALARAGSNVFDLTSATGSLVGALSDKREQVQSAAAAALAEFRGPVAQQGLAALAEGADAGEKVRLDAYEALATSLRLQGNRLTKEQVDAIADVVKGEGALNIRVAAAKVQGIIAEKVEGLILAAPER